MLRTKIIVVTALLSLLVSTAESAPPYREKIHKDLYDALDRANEAGKLLASEGEGEGEAEAE